MEDLVYFINDQDEKNGPFIVREILDGNKCTLSELDYTTAANGGVAVSVKSLEKVV